MFERLFGAADSTDATARLARLPRTAACSTSSAGEAAALRRALGSTDGAKLEQYLEAVRDAERRIQTAERQADREMPVFEQPVGIPDTFEEHAKLM